MSSAAFQRFQFSFFEDEYSARDGLDQAALAELHGEERVEAEDLLLDFLPDARGAIGLGVLRSQRAEPRLTEMLAADPTAHACVYAAKALWRIRPDPRWLAALIGVLASCEDWTQRFEAALALYDVRDPKTVAPLTKALDDPEPLVRHHAARALLASHGLPAGSNDKEHMIYRVMAADAARREAGKRDILAAIVARPLSAP